MRSKISSGGIISPGGIMSDLDETSAYSVENEANRYRDRRRILRSEEIYGSGFQSPGGLSGFTEILGQYLDLRPGMSVLDIGSGLGGAAFHLARQFDVDVIGIDTAPLMCEIATSRNSEMNTMRRVKFINGTIFDISKSGICFDLIYSRDTLMYDPAKADTFRECHKILKTSGKLLVTDFCRLLPDISFDNYSNTCGYHPLTIEEYVNTIREAGFTITQFDDISSTAIRQLKGDLTRYESVAREGGHDTSDEDFTHLSQRWRLKMDFLERGRLTQGRFVAAK